MGMVVQHNISAMNANEAMRKNVAGLKKQTEKLSTGYNINRAADNAAGLAISEKMRSQIRGLTQASANSNDAISLIQTAEGGLQETEDILQRMRELSVQSANGTYTDEDRQQIQYEVDALKEEVDRISQATEYNEMKLLDGSLAGKGPTNGEYGAKYGVINDGVVSDEIETIAASTDATAVAGAIYGLGAAGTGTDANTAAENQALIEKTLGITISDDLKTDGAWNSEKAADIKKEIAKAISGMTADTVKDIANTLKNAGVDSDVDGAFTDEINKNLEGLGGLINDAGGASAGFDGAVLTSNVQGASINVTTDATKSGESASWGKDGKTLTLNLVSGKTYTQDDIDKLIAGADTKKADGVVADVSLKLKDGVYTAKAGDATSKTYAGVRAESKTISLLAADADAVSTAETKVSDALAAAKTAVEAIDEDDLEKGLAVLGLGSDKKAADGTEGVDKALEKMSAGEIREAADKIAEINSDAATALRDLASAKEAVPVGAGVLKAATTGYGDQIKFTSNTYGVDNRSFKIATDAKAGSESVEATKDDTDGLKNGEYTIHLSTGVEYSNDDIEKLMAKAGLDYTVDISDSNKPDGDVKMKLDNAVAEKDAQSFGMDYGKGVGKDETTTSGKGLTFQIGANGVEDQRLTVNVEDMSSRALGIKNISVAKQDDANDAINKIDDALKAVSTQRAKLGAVQNRLEHTVNSLNTANENLSASESQIRDTDMATEMIKYTKSNILQQASQSMLAQANQQPQGVLQLLG